MEKNTSIFFSTFGSKINEFEGEGMYLIFPVIVIVTVTVLLQCLSCSFGQNWKANIADMHYDCDYDCDNVLERKKLKKRKNT